jgi:cation diffusion facilitator family transporter
MSPDSSPSIQPIERATSALSWGRVLLAVNVVLTAGKVSAYAITGSVAILSDAIESIANVVTSLLTLYALWLSARPRDDEHPYGHGRVEYFASAFEGALIFSAGIAIAAIAVVHWQAGEPPRALTWGALVEAIIGLALWGFGTASVRRGRRLNSPTLVSGGEHLKSDAITTFAVVAGVGVVWITEIAVLDELIAGVFGIYICFAGLRLVREAIGGLMDKADPGILEGIATSLERIRRPGWSSPHHAKVQRLGQRVHIDLHVVFPRFWTLEATHEAAEEIEAGLCRQFGADSELMLHMEPCRPAACPSCDLSDCTLRSAPFVSRTAWTGPSVAAPTRQQPGAGGN